MGEQLEEAGDFFLQGFPGRPSDTELSKAEKGQRRAADRLAEGKGALGPPALLSSCTAPPAD